MGKSRHALPLTQAETLHSVKVKLFFPQLQSNRETSIGTKQLQKEVIKKVISWPGLHYTFDIRCDVARWSECEGPQTAHGLPVLQQCFKSFIRKLFSKQTNKTFVGKVKSSDL